MATLEATTPARAFAVAPDGTRGGELSAALSLEALGPELARGAEEARQRGKPYTHWIPDGEGGVKQLVIPPTPPNVEHLANGPAGMVRFADLAVLQREDPARATALWARLQEAAKVELDQGHSAARVISGTDERPFERARFLVLREALVSEWQPRGITEQILIDNVVQAMVMRARYLSLAHHYEDPAEVYAEPDFTETPWQMREREAAEQRERSLQPPRLTQIEAIDRAMHLAEKFDRMATRAIRALRDLRRQTVFIQNEAGGQVNVGQQQQVNNGR